jgi:hypothetical protein
LTFLSNVAEGVSTMAKHRKKPPRTHAKKAAMVGGAAATVSPMAEETPDSWAAKIVVGALASGALATGGWAFGSSAPAHGLACLAVGGVGSIGDSSCAATAPGAVALDLGGTTATAGGAGDTAIAIGPGTSAIATGGTNNSVTAIGLSDLATSVGGSNSNTTAIGIGNTATNVGLSGLSTPGVPTVGLGGLTATTSSTGSHNNTTALGIGNTALTMLGNNNNNSAIGVGNTATVIGTPGLTGSSGTITIPGSGISIPVSGTVSPTGNGNTNTAAGVGNIAATTLGVNNKNTAVGALNTATVTGSPGVTGSATITVPGTGINIPASANVTQTGVGNTNTAGGSSNLATTTLGSNNQDTALGLGNTVTRAKSLFPSRSVEAEPARQRALV